MDVGCADGVAGVVWDESDSDEKFVDAVQVTGEVGPAIQLLSRVESEDGAGVYLSE